MRKLPSTISESEFLEESEESQTAKTKTGFHARLLPGNEGF